MVADGDLAAGTADKAQSRLRTGTGINSDKHEQQL